MVWYVTWGRQVFDKRPEWQYQLYGEYRHQGEGFIIKYTGDRIGPSGVSIKSVDQVVLNDESMIQSEQLGNIHINL